MTIAQNCVAFHCATSDHPAEAGFACNGKVRSLEFWNGARIMHKLLLMEPSSFLSCLPASLRCVVTFSLQTFLNKASDERFTTEQSCFVSAGNQKWGQQLYLSEWWMAVLLLAARPVWSEMAVTIQGALLVLKGQPEQLQLCWASEPRLSSVRSKPLNSRQMWGLVFPMSSSRERLEESQIPLILTKAGSV